MNGLRKFISKARGWKLVLVFLACVIGIGNVAGTRAVSNTSSGASGGVPALFQEYCIHCHGTVAPKAGVNLALMVAQPSVGESFRMWERVAQALEERAMPPKAMPQPSDEERAQALAWIRGELGAYAKKHDGEPGEVTIRRLTSGEYAYTIKDLTGLDLNVGIDSSSDAVGGEGFTNFGDVQFMQDANLERYLKAAKLIAEHAVIGAGPLDFFVDPGKTGFEFSAVARIRDN
jgi:mono/diheme cytochrome c family protein